jgi:hypothetical protein
MAAPAFGSGHARAKSPAVACYSRKIGREPAARSGQASKCNGEGFHLPRPLSRTCLLAYAGHVPLKSSGSSQEFWCSLSSSSGSAPTLFASQPMAKRNLPLTITRASAGARACAPAAAHRLHLSACDAHCPPFLSRTGTVARSLRHGRDRIDMRQASTRDLFGYWNALRGSRKAPDRSEINPGEIRASLPDVFLLRTRRAARPSLPPRRNHGLRLVRA